jgi:hypothetical protein
MSTIPPEQSGGGPGGPGTMGGPGGQRGYNWGGGTSGAILPIPGNAEFLVWALMLIIFAIVAGIADDVDSHMWVVAATWITAAYLLSRGIAKASRVLEQ